MTATSRKALRQLVARDGHVSAWTGEDVPELVPQHRLNRGMGGSRQLDRVSNLVWIESEINGLIEADPEWAKEAEDRGIKLRSWQLPENVPVTFADGRKLWLTRDGRKISWNEDTDF